MAPNSLDAGSSPPVGVAAPSRIDFYVGNPPRQMSIFSGVAICEVSSQEEEDLVGAEIVVTLGAITTEVFTYTCMVGLASVSVEDSDFNLFADQSVVDRDKFTGALSLRVPVKVSGEPASVHRVSYHAQVLSDPVTSLIAGTIRWADLYGQPDPEVRIGLVMIAVLAGHTVEDPPDDSGFRHFHWETHATGYASAVPQDFAGTWAIPYTMEPSVGRVSSRCARTQRASTSSTSRSTIYPTRSSTRRSAPSS